MIIYLHNFVSHTVTNWKNAESEKLVSKRKSDHYVGAWLKVDEKNKKVHYQVDPSWMKNTSDEEQKITFGKLSLLADVYRRAGYAIIDFVKKYL